MTSHALAALGGLLALFATPANAQTLELRTERGTALPQRAALQQPVQRAQLTRNAPPAGAALLAPTGGSDACATAELISGTGSFPFNNGTATSSPEGQLTTNCIQFNQIGVPNDVWFLWTAPSTGRIEIGSCGSAGAIDSKIAVYNGPTCPLSGGTAIVCNDDFTDYYLQARVFLDVTQNQQYLIQIGVSPLGGIPGTDAFDIKYLTDSCTHDDGSAELVVGFNVPAGSEMAWFERFGTVGQNQIVSQIQGTFGASWDVTPPLVLNGMPVTGAIWDDPNDDGNPNDLVLLATIAGTVSQAHTDIYETFTFSSPVTVNGIFFLGFKAATGSTIGAAPMVDEDSCGVLVNRFFLAVSSGSSLDLSNMNSAVQPPISAAAYTGLWGEWMIRGNCAPATAGTPFCFGDGTGTLCPCSPSPVPHGAAGRGCPSNIFAGGALAVATGIPSLTADSLVLTATDMINGSMIFYQGATQQSGGAGAVFGDGKRCIQPTGIRRFKVKPVVGNTASYPQVGDNSISVAGAVGAPGPMQYQGWYRSANPTFCTIATFNLTNGLTVTWLP